MPLSDALAAVDAAERELLALRESSRPPERPDRDWADDWLHRSRLAYWESGRL